ncbi:MAG: hypothetical protein U0800_25390 [Isosphaeraceae bacterium]
MSWTRRLATSLTTGLLLWCPFLLAQDKPRGENKPDDLEKLLEKLESRPVGKADDPKPAPADKPEGKPGQAPAQKPKGTPAKDKDLDDLLEKLGKTEEAPTTSGKAAPKPPADPDPAAKPDGDASKGRRGPLNDESRKLDQRLEEILGRKKKKPQEEQDGEGSEMLAGTIKKMREVEQRLEQPDTGEATRKKQEEIVQDLGQILKEAQKKAQQSSKKKMAQRKQQQKGEQDGDQPGNEAGTAPRGTEKPTGEHALVGDKGAWGHLPETLREEMANIFKEGYLPAQADLIKRYYMSVNKKALARGE